MATYAEAGVDIEKGDKCSALAYAAAKRTFAGREGKIGSGVVIEGGFTGMMDFGDFYIVQNCDGVGTKTLVAKMMNKYDTLGYDLLAMVADDMIVVGAECISITNTIDIYPADENAICESMKGLEKACLEEKIVIPGGEIAELSGIIEKGAFSWNTDGIGILEKDKYIDTKDIKPGDLVIGLESSGIHSNGLSLARYVLREKYGENWAKEDFGNGKFWGEVILTPTKIYHRAILGLTGEYKEARKVEIKGICHITGGGIPGNLPRILKATGFGANLDNLIEPQEEFKKLIEIGKVSRAEAYKTWNMGIGMVLVIDPKDEELVKHHFMTKNIKAQKIGVITKKEGIFIN